MGRKIASLNSDYLKQAVSYLRGAQQRNNKVFIKPAQAVAELTRLEEQLATLKEDDAVALFRAWLDLHLTAKGRTTMLNALRRKRADAKPGRPRRRAISVSPGVYLELERLSKNSGGIPLPSLLESLAAIANVDKKLQAQIFKVSVALSLKAEPSPVAG